MLSYKVYYRRKPTEHGKWRINHSHPLAEGLDVFTPLVPFDRTIYINGQYEQLQKGGAGGVFWHTSGGRNYLIGDAAAGSVLYTQSTTVSPPEDHPFTLASNFITPAGSSSFRYMAAVSKFNPGLALDSAERPYIYLGGQTVGRQTAVPVSTFIPVAATREGGTGEPITLWLNNVSSDTGTTTSRANSDFFCLLAADELAANPAAAQVGIEYVAYWPNRFLNDSERAQLIANPWVLLKPRTVWVPVEALPPGPITGTGTLQAQAASVVGAGIVIPAITGTGALQAGSAAVVGVGEIIGIATGTGALQAQDAAVSGVGDVISPDVGTGTLQAQSAQVSGIGAVVHAGSGALQAQSAAVVGVGEVGNVRTGTGALQAGEAAVVGTGIRVSVGSGALQAGDAAVSGAGVVEGLVSGTGALQAQSATVAGTGHLIRVGSGALQAQGAQVAGVGAILGELTLSPADIAAIADAVYAKLVSEGLVTQINEIWQRRGLDPANPQTYDKAGNEIRVGNITIDLSGDPSSVTQTRQP